MGANNFLVLPTVPAGVTTGPRPAIDLWSLVSPSGLNPGFSVICQGDFQGTIGLEGSLDGAHFAPVGASVDASPTNNIGVVPLVAAGGFSLGPKNRNIIPVGTFELSPLIVPDVVRFLRLNIAPGTTVFGPVVVTLGGEQNCDCASGGGGGSVGGFEVIDTVRPPDMTVGHHILRADFNPPSNTCVIPAGTQDKETHTFYSARLSNPNVGQFVRLTQVNPVTGVVSVNTLLGVAADTTIEVEWDADDAAWIRKITTPQDAVPLVNDLEARLNASDTPFQGASMIGIGSQSSPFFTGYVRMDEASLLIGQNGLLQTANLNTGSSVLSAFSGSVFIAAQGSIGVNSDATLDPTGVTTDEFFRLVRLDVSAFTIEVINGGPGAGTLYTFPPNEARMAEFKFNGTDWVLWKHARINYNP